MSFFRAAQLFGMCKDFKSSAFMHGTPSYLPQLKSTIGGEKQSQAGKLAISFLLRISPSPIRDRRMGEGREGVLQLPLIQQIPQCEQFLPR